MGEVAIVGGDLSVLSRWADAIRVAGRDSRLIAPGVLDREPVAFARYCLFDLGQRAAADPQPLLDAVAAHPGVGFVAMTSRPEAAEGLRLLRGGVRGYCNRLASPMVIQALLGAVAQGEIWAGREVTEYLLRPGAAAPAKASMLYDRLTEREAEIAEQVAAGRSNKAIAADSGITERTVKAHLNSIFRKTGIRNRVQLALSLAAEPARRRRRLTG